MADDDKVKVLVHALLTHRWDVELVERENGTRGVALLLDGWRSNYDSADVATWQDMVDELRDAVGVGPMRPGRDGRWTGTVVSG